MERILPVAGLLVIIGAHAAAASQFAPMDRFVGHAVTHPSTALQPILGDRPRGDKSKHPKEGPKEGPKNGSKVKDPLILPEPGSLALLISGLAAAGIVRRAKRRKDDVGKGGHDK